jgi:kynurenine formamidase
VSPPSLPPTTTFEELAASVRNWGRWGPDDERGCLNFITDDKRRAAAGLVRRGASFSLSIPLDENGPQAGGGGRTNPSHLVTRSGNDPATVNGVGGTAHFTDDLLVQFYLQAGTQWDALAHVFYDGQLYNGFPASGITSKGTNHLGFDKYYDQLVTRGVLVDVARAQGVDTLPDDYVIDSAELDDVLAAQGVGVEGGDIVLVRTGLMALHDATGSWAAFNNPCPGVHYEVAAWCHRHDVAALAADNMAVEARTGWEGLGIPLHMLALRDMGMPLGEFFYLEALAADCAADGVYEFMLVAPGLRVTGALGSPVTPIALK